MDNKIASLAIFICAIIMYILGFFSGASKEKIKTDWPEEIKAISNNFTQPDTLLGYQSNGTIHICFKH